MELTITFNVEEQLRKELEGAKLDEKEIKKILDNFSDWIDPTVIGFDAEDYLDDLAGELISDFIDDRHPQLKEKIYSVL
ncbi:hypothetical protein [Desmospora activa]|uniref:Uncharacterized protein n=1 Tax=Desmospora activa DSM 45169 TaxID=1121389 RepID=A0A2T4YXG0_9BACL|nr:hypothetical protein [Desmospora activa]PTM50664.1 hypothetical protein C8J48_3790 [Desmospora activa DSM 45169]PTM51711.1 hypothetical protein C8J48_3764 [Desmospora activa DSM 45169]